MAYIRSPGIASKEERGTIKIGEHLIASPDGEVSVDVGSIVSEGAWQPRLISGPDGGGIVAKVLYAKYCKFGTLVHALFDLQVADMEKGKSSSYVMLEGLPFISVKSDGYCGSLVVTYFKNLDSSASFLSGSVRPDSYACELWYGNKSVTTLEKLEYGDVRVSTRLQGIIYYNCL
jgi:hypothetical protein